MPKKGTQTIELECSMVRELGQAIVVKVDYDEYILPNSQVEWSSTGERDEDGNEKIELTLPEWLAMDRGVI